MIEIEPSFCYCRVHFYGFDQTNPMFKKKKKNTTTFYSSKVLVFTRISTNRPVRHLSAHQRIIIILKQGPDIWIWRSCCLSNTRRSCAFTELLRSIIYFCTSIFVIRAGLKMRPERAILPTRVTLRTLSGGRYMWAVCKWSNLLCLIDVRTTTYQQVYLGGGAL